jgi:choline-sulfatase
MDRRDFLASAAAATLSAAVVKDAGAESQKSVPQKSESRKQPNVLLLMSDQHKRSCMGACGDGVAKTPNLDALAADSVRFSNAYCTDPVCTPSRASILTGLYSHHHGALDNSRPYSHEIPTLAHHFNRAGYMTALIGKMHFVDAQTHGFEYRLDFNDWLQYLGPKVQVYADELGARNSGAGLPQIDDLWREEGDPWKGHRTLDGRKGGVAVGRVSLLEEKDHFESFVARESVRFLLRFAKEGHPFFLVSSFLKPHDPLMPAQRFADMFKAEDMRLPNSYDKADTSKLPSQVARAIENHGGTPEFHDPENAKKRIAFYYANLAQMDDCLGQVVNAVKELNLENDTIICYTSDHGEMLGTLGLWQKFQFYEGSCGVPLLIRVPGRTPGVCETPVSLVSLSATLTDLAGVAQVKPNDGISIAPWVEAPRSRKEYGPVFAEYGLASRQPKSMIREGRWKYTYWLHDKPELYDLESDPEELHNLAGEPGHAEKEEALRTRLLAWNSFKS